MDKDKDLKQSKINFPTRKSKQTSWASAEGSEDQSGKQVSAVNNTNEPAFPGLASVEEMKNEPSSCFAAGNLLLGEDGKPVVLLTANTTAYDSTKAHWTDIDQN